MGSLFARKLVGVAKKMNEGGNFKSLHLYLIYFCEQHIATLFTTLLNNKPGF